MSDMQRASAPKPAAAYSRQEAGELIAAASELQEQRQQLREELREGLTYDQVVEIAAELGVDEQDLLAAIERRNHAPATARAIAHPSRDRWRRRRGRIYRWHLATYVGVISGLTVIDYFADPAGLDWVYFPAAGWGMFLLTHAVGRVLTRRQG